MRYKQLLDILRDVKPKIILEIGTWNGGRAMEMMLSCPDATYYGFDLFEDATLDTDKTEFNVKPHNSIENVSYYLKMGKFPFHLTKGNTIKTLVGFNIPVDFAFIDGGHSIETIKSDWINVKRIIKDTGIVVFDDYYTDVPDDFLESYGCNKIIDNLPHIVLSDKDKVKCGGYVQLVKIKGGL